jgi:Ino eighty subunit 2
VVLEDTESGQQEDEKKEPEKINPIFIRYKQNKDGTTLGVPDEWLQAPAGAFFNGKLAQPVSRPFSGRMVEEVS